MNRGDIAWGSGTMLLGVFLCLAFVLFDSWILLAGWLYGLPMVLAGQAVFRDGIKGRREVDEARSSPIARLQSFPSETKREVWARDRGECALCGTRLDLRFGYVDPTIGDAPANLRVVCGSCNRSLVGRIE